MQLLLIFYCLFAIACAEQKDNGTAKDYEEYVCHASDYVDSAQVDPKYAEEVKKAEERYRNLREECLLATGKIDKCYFLCLLEKLGIFQNGELYLKGALQGLEQIESKELAQMVLRKCAKGPNPLVSNCDIAFDFFKCYTELKENNKPK